MKLQAGMLMSLKFKFAKASEDEEGVGVADDER